MQSKTTRSAWRTLAAHADEIQNQHLRTLFDEDAERFDRFSLSDGGLLVDFSKNRVTGHTLHLLCNLAEAADVEGWRERMFSGETVNTTEHRAALHVALRNRESAPIPVAGIDVMPGVNNVLRRMGEFVHRVRSGEWLGFSGEPIRSVVNLGIGGSVLGPKMAHAALQPFHDGGPDVHYVANVDGDDLAQCLAGLEPETTLFIVASKTFTTRETMANARAARHWLQSACGDDGTVARHFVALSTNRDAVIAFGIDPGNMFEFWDWVGGRFSLWSSIGLSLALAIGMEQFEEMLDGAHAMDDHFRGTPMPRNIPIVLALVGIWNTNFLGAPTHAVVPYSHRLRYLPAYLQQLDMESNGKSVTREGKATRHATAPVVWGEPGTNSQHSFFQLLHQGGRLVPVDLIGVVNSEQPSDQQRLLLANLVAQSAALMHGRSAAEARRICRAAGCTPEETRRLAPHRTFAGNQPSNTLLLRRLTPYTLGQLLALYEHKTFVQGAVWDINSFDQWGVELGKELAEQFLEDESAARDSSTRGLLTQCRYWHIPGSVSSRSPG